jgi:hypothetical protein
VGYAESGSEIWNDDGGTDRRNLGLGLCRVARSVGMSGRERCTARALYPSHDHGLHSRRGALEAGMRFWGSKTCWQRWVEVWKVENSGWSGGSFEVAAG